MLSDTNFSMHMDSTLQSQAVEVLSELELTMSGAFTMFLKQIVREQAIPLTPSPHPHNAVYNELREVQADRQNGYQGRNARKVLSTWNE